MKPILVLVTKDGLHARAINTFDKKIDVFDCEIVSIVNKEWQHFEATVKTYDLTKWCEPSSVIEVKLVWESYDHNDGYNDWGICEYPDRERNNGYRTRQFYQPILITDVDKIVSDNSLDSLSAVRDFYAKRKNIDEDYPKEETVEEAAEDNYPYVKSNIYDNGCIDQHNFKITDLRKAFTVGANWQKRQTLNQYNKAIEDAIDVLQRIEAGQVECRLDYLIDQLKQLTQKP